MTDTITCSHCGKAERRHKTRRGLCSACDQYKRRHGIDRPLATSTKCKNPHCDRQVGIISATKGKGLCPRCRQYKAMRGKEWTPDVSKRSKFAPVPICTICKERKAERTKPVDMCHRCYSYWLRNKKRRPRWRDAEHCSNCKQPRSYEPGAFVKGRCRRCYNYWNDNKQERPAKLWGVGELGWCDCGQPAKHEMVVPIQHHTDKLSLCDDCYAEEMRQQKIYGVTYDRKGTGANSSQQPGHSFGGDD